MTAPRTIKAGDRFEHARQLDPDWRPGPGQRYADAPMRGMRVTRVTFDTIYYRPDDDGTKGVFVAARGELHNVVGRWLTEEG
jgi:hypothetical protein